MQNIRKFNWKLSVLITWLLLGLYFGSGGITKMENYNLIKSTIEQTDTTTVVYKGITFQNKGALLRTLEEEETESIFPWIGSLPSYVSYMITACAFGLLGTIIRLFIHLAIEQKPLETLPVYTLPVLGLLSGLVVLGISLIFPALLFNSDKDIKPSGLMFICLFSGIYVDKLYEGLSNFFTRKFDEK
jgi:hypothetical protein